MRAFLSADVEHPLRKGKDSLQDESRLSDTRFATKQNDTAGHKAATEDAVELAVVHVDARLVAGRDVTEVERAASAGGMAYGTESRGGAKGSVTSHILRFRCGNTHFLERVPLPAIRAFPYPLGRVVAAVLTNVCYLILSH